MKFRGNYFGSKNFGLNTRHREGMRTRAPMRQAKMDTITRNPKNFTGKKLENMRAANPMMTENALNIIPLPVVVRVLLTPSTGVRPFRLSSLYLQRKWIV